MRAPSTPVRQKPVNAEGQTTWYLMVIHDYLCRGPRESSLPSNWGSFHLRNNILHKYSGEGVGLQHWRERHHCLDNLRTLPFPSLLGPFPHGGLISHQSLSLAFLQSTLFCCLTVLSLVPPDGFAYLKTNPFQWFKSFKLGFLLFYPKASKTSACLCVPSNTWNLLRMYSMFWWMKKEMKEEN